VRLQIPAIGVDTSLQHLGKANNGTVQVPTGPHQWDQAGWYPGPGGTRPGDPGRRHGVPVRRRPGRAVPQDALSYHRRLLPHSDPRLRLVTCGGSFDFAAWHYRSNVIAFATPQP
jgi:hypothetical protein